MPDFESGDRGAEPRSGAILPVGVIATRLAYTQESGERNLHGRPFSAAVRQDLLLIWVEHPRKRAAAGSIPQRGFAAIPKSEISRQLAPGNSFEEVGDTSL